MSTARRMAWVAGEGELVRPLVCPVRPCTQRGEYRGRSQSSAVCVQCEVRVVWRSGEGYDVVAVPAAASGVRGAPVTVSQSDNTDAIRRVVTTVRRMVC